MQHDSDHDCLIFKIKVNISNNWRMRINIPDKESKLDEILKNSYNKEMNNMRNSMTKQKFSIRQFVKQHWKQKM